MPLAPDTSRRLAGLAVALAAAALLALAAALTPATDGHGTHAQMGLPACGWVIAFDQPCVTCGMTTAFAHAADGGLGSAARVQPLGAVLALATAAAFWGGVHTAVTACRINGLLNAILSARALWALAAAAALAWGYKILTW